MSRLVPNDPSADLVKLARLAAELSVSGKAFPCHPKKPGVPHVAAIAAAAGIPDALLRSGPGAAQLAALVKGHLSDAPAERRRAAAARIETMFANRPLPRRGNSVHKEQVAHHAGISLLDVNSPECGEVIARLRKTNGMVRIRNDKAAERAALQAFEAKLCAEGRGVPTSPARGTPAITTIARAIGVPKGRFSHEPLRTELAAMVARRGLACTDLIADQASRLESFVTAQIAANVPAPRYRGGIAYRQVGTKLGIVAYRLKSNPKMRTSLARWISACGLAS